MRRGGDDWQTGMLNLPGGKIEIGEEPCFAAQRELREETGFSSVVELVGKIEGFDFEIWIYRAYKAGLRNYRPDEILEFHKWSDIQLNQTLVGNLRLVIPLVKSGTKNWVLKDIIAESSRIREKNNLDFNYKLQFRRNEQEMMLSV